MSKLFNQTIDDTGVDAERERKQQAAQLAATQTLSSGFAHELRNPLNSATLQLELLERRLKSHFNDPRFSEPIELVRHEIKRLTALVTDFLAFARPPPLMIELHDVTALVEEVIDLERPGADYRGITLELVARSSVDAKIDSRKIRQVVQNLVRNAVEATAAGGHVAVRVCSEGDRVHLRVADDGPGLSDRARARMYEPFFSTKDTGTGLGMSIVHSLVSMHGGTIDVMSTPAGTQFDVSLPRAA